MLTVAPYSSNPPAPLLSEVITPNEPRKTHLGRKFQESPSRGWKLFRSRLPMMPLGWVIAPLSPVTGSIVSGSNCDCWSYLVLNGEEYVQRSPRFSDRLGRTFQSSWKYSS